MFRFHLNHLVKPALVLLLNTVSARTQDVHKVSPSSVVGLTRSQAQVQAHGTKEQAVYGGVALGDLVRRLGAPAGEAIRGAGLSMVVIVKAADGYQAVFTLPELDPLFTKKVVLLADRRNGAALTTKEGPYRLVVPEEGRQARWVRQVVSIELRALN